MVVIARSAVGFFGQEINVDAVMLVLMFVRMADQLRI